MNGYFSAGNKQNIREFHCGEYLVIGYSKDRDALSPTFSAMLYESHVYRLELITAKAQTFLASRTYSSISANSALIRIT